ncbi:hypothetical protein Godav_000676, partial [Gossypium davidsonii]|nr:hypothetical protein [Gossypium davidsonii]
MHSLYSVGPPPNGRLVARVAITARFGYGGITSIGCNSHFAYDSAIRDFALFPIFYSNRCSHQALFHSFHRFSHVSLPE